jgi:hypothetical protein
MDAATRVADASAGMVASLGLAARPRLAGCTARPPMVAADATRRSSQTHCDRAGRAVDRRWSAVRHLPHCPSHHPRSRAPSADPPWRERVVPIALDRCRRDLVSYLAVLDRAAHPGQFNWRVGVVWRRPRETNPRGCLRGLAMYRSGLPIHGRFAGGRVEGLTIRTRRLATRRTIVVGADVSFVDRHVRWCVQAAQARANAAVRGLTPPR